MPRPLPTDAEPPAGMAMVAARLIRAGVPTPFLAVSRDAIRAALARWQKYLSDVPPHYAVKANIDPLVTGELHRQGASADVASAFEMDAAAAVGFTGDRMIMSNPRKDRDTIQAMVRFRPWATTVDSEDEVFKLADAGIPSSDYRPTLFVRIKVPTRGVKQDLSSKFGIRVVEADTGSGDLRLRPDELRGVLAAARNAGFTSFGLAFHVGTQCYDPQVYRLAVSICRKLARNLEQSGIKVEWIDIGGGFPDARIAERHADRIDAALHDTARELGDEAAFAPLLRKSAHDKLLYLIGLAARAVAKDGFRLLAEPGRYLVADAGFLVTRVIYDRSTEITGRRVQIDDGVYRTLSGRVHDEREFEFVPLRTDSTRPPLAARPTPFAVWGCSCDSFDKVADEVSLPADLAVGDYLLAGCVGAYSTSFGSNTNGFQPAPVVLYSEDGGEFQWEVSPLAEQNAILLAHIRRWAADRRGNP